MTNWVVAPRPTCFGDVTWFVYTQTKFRRYFVMTLALSFSLKHSGMGVGKGKKANDKSLVKTKHQGENVYRA